MSCVPVFPECTTDGVNENLNGSLVVVLIVVKYVLDGVELDANVGLALVAAATVTLNAFGVAYVDGGRYVVDGVVAFVVDGVLRYWDRPR